MAVLLRHDEGPVAHLTLNRPEALNALSDELLAALTSEFLALKEDRSIRVVTLSGAGKAFCAGHDLREMQAGRKAADGGADYFFDLFGRCAEVMNLIPTLPQPVIARVHGIATAAGCQLVAACDLAVAAETARFGVNGINIGLFCSTPMVALSRNIGRKKAFEMLTTGRFLSAGEAEKLGLINKVVAEVNLDVATRDLAGQLAAKLGSALAIGKVAFYEQLQMDQRAAYAYVRGVMTTNMMHPDTDEGIQAFVEKRAPNWEPAKPEDG